MRFDFDTRSYTGNLLGHLGSGSRLLLAGLAAVSLAACSESPSSPEITGETTAVVDTVQDIGPQPYVVRLNESLLGLQLVSNAVDSTLALIGAEAAFLKYDTVFKGFAARLTEQQVAALEQLPIIASVRPDTLVSISGTQTSPTYGLDRIDELSLPMDGVFSYPDSAGAGVHVYVLDSGINPDHVEFSGRVGTGRNFINDGPIGIDSLIVLNLGGIWEVLGYQPDPDAWQDCNGHGTHVSGTAVGTTYGVAKQATVHPIRVLGCAGTGAFSGIIAGMEWVAENAERPAVVNMSLGAGSNPDIDAATNALFAAGILPLVAAGNDNADACGHSPAAAVNAVTVGSTDAADNESSFSNHGTCVDIFAPGTDVVSASYSNTTGTSTLSGTSMATPHVAGAAAFILGETPSLSPADVTAALISNATSGTIALSPATAGSPNLLLNAFPEGAKQ